MTPAQLRDTFILGLMFFALQLATLHLWSLERGAETTRLNECTTTIEEALPLMYRRLAELTISHRNLGKAHHQAVGVLDGIAYRGGAPQSMKHYKPRETEDR